MTTRPSSSAAAPAPSTREVNAHTAFTLFAGTCGLGEASRCLLPVHCDTAAPPEEAPETGRRKTKPLKVRLSDVAMAAHANNSYSLVVGGHVFVGTTSANGEVEREIPDAVQIKEFAPPDAPAGAELRLRNLGYYTGAVNDTLSFLPDAAVEGLKEFQRDHGLETTGKLDGPTVAKLQSMCGQ